jgi:hypothetical protein
MLGKTYMLRKGKTRWEYEWTTYIPILALQPLHWGQRILGRKKYRISLKE